MKIKKQWCVYGAFPDSIGKVVAEDDEACSVDVLYAEGQMYPAEEWEKKDCRRFKTPEDAIGFVAGRTGQNVQEVTRLFRQNFPSAKAIGAIPEVR